MKNLYFILALSFSIALESYAQRWPDATQETKAGVRWWWMGSSFNEESLRWNLEQYSKTGIGTIEITPIYGVQNNESTELSFLSKPWMNALKFIEEEGTRNKIQIDMNCGTGWPFGGPLVEERDMAAKVEYFDTTIVVGECSMLDVRLRDAKERKWAKLSRVMAYSKSKKKEIHNLTSNVNNLQLDVNKAGLKKGEKYQIIALYCSRTQQLVKRAAPGGEGYVIDHFNRDAVKRYLERFDRAFSESGVPYPKTFFNDSYEVYGADWTPSLFEEFQKRRGYKLEEHLPELFGMENDGNQTLSDYRETLGELLLENFTEQWTDWAHKHGVIIRNQSHGSPANLLDIYSAVDIPEIEGYGLSDFGIKGLRTDSGFTRKNYSDVSMLKYASSAAHVCGKKLTSSETFTWLTEHFRTSLSQCKPDLDLMFSCGINRIFFHGTCYSPPTEPWPGWKFYASIDMSPTNSIWRDAPEIMDYIQRCQSFLQWGKPDNDFLVYLPIYDMWHKRFGKQILMQFSIHDMNKLSPEFISDILTIDSLGYDCDYISDKYLLGVTCNNGRLKTAAGTTYNALIIPGSGKMPVKVRKHLEKLKKQGAKIIYGTNEGEMAKTAKPEEFRTRLHLRCLRQKNDIGYHYFLANLTPNDVDEYVPLTVDFASAALFKPMTGEIIPILPQNGKLHIVLRSGESVILQAYKEKMPLFNEDGWMASAQKYFRNLKNQKWELSFIEEAPKVNGKFQLDSLCTWETLNNESAQITMGTGVYTTTINLSQKDLQCKSWSIDLGDVRESARVYINDRYIGTAWAVPFMLDFADGFHEGENTIRIEVTNLPANRIADMDRKGIKWRRFKNANMVNISDTTPNTYADWKPVKSGLNSDVILYRNW